MTDRYHRDANKRKLTCNNGDLCVSNVTPARLRGIHARVAGLPLNSLGVVMNILSQPEKHKRI